MSAWPSSTKPWQSWAGDADSRDIDEPLEWAKDTDNREMLRRL
jgi:hypothetical protein